MVDVEAAVGAKTTDECMVTLARIADLFLLHADNVNDDHVAVFDDVLLRLVEAVEKEAKCELGRRLAPIDNAPAHTIRHLAHHDDIAVAAPVLARSAQLSEEDLLDIARTKGQDHLAAIAEPSRPRGDGHRRHRRARQPRGDRQAGHQCGRHHSPNAGFPASPPAPKATTPSPKRSACGSTFRCGSCGN